MEEKPVATIAAIAEFLNDRARKTSDPHGRPSPTAPPL
jgi:hypothetical protein